MGHCVEHFVESVRGVLLFQRQRPVPVGLKIHGTCSFFVGINYFRSGGMLVPASDERGSLVGDERPATNRLVVVPQAGLSLDLLREVVVHVKLGRLVGSVPLGPPLRFLPLHVGHHRRLPLPWSGARDVDLSVEVAGLRLRHPQGSLCGLGNLVRRDDRIHRRVQMEWLPHR